MKLLITCGGTGGHFYPGLAIATKAKEQGVDVLVALSGKNTDKFHKVANDAGINSVIVSSFSRSTQKWKLPLLILLVMKDLFLSWRLIGKEKPDAVLGMGSFASFGVCFAAVLRRKSLYLHEGNAVVGSSNCFLSKYAKKLLLSFDAVNKSQLKCPSEIVGFPVRKNFVESKESTFDRAELLSKFGLDEDKKTVLIFGGSQGAKAINSAVSEIFCSYSKNDQVQVLHLAGNVDEQKRLQEVYQKGKIKATVLDYVEDMASCYHISDAAIARAGAASLFELALFKIPTLAVPLPWAADNHQQKNAQAVNIVAGKEIVNICLQSELKNGAIEQFFDTLLEQNQNLEKSAEQFSKILDGKKAATEVVYTILEGAKK